MNTSSGRSEAEMRPSVDSRVCTTKCDRRVMIVRKDAQASQSAAPTPNIDDKFFELSVHDAQSLQKDLREEVYVLICFLISPIAVCSDQGSVSQLLTSVLFQLVMLVSDKSRKVVSDLAVQILSHSDIVRNVFSSLHRFVEAVGFTRNLSLCIQILYH